MVESDATPVVKDYHATVYLLVSPGNHTKEKEMIRCSAKFIVSIILTAILAAIIILCCISTLEPEDTIKPDNTNNQDIWHGYIELSYRGINGQRILTRIPANETISIRFIESQPHPDDYDHESFATEPGESSNNEMPEPDNNVQ